MELLLTLLCIALAVYVAFWIVDRVGPPDPFGLILRVIVGVIALVFLVNAVGGIPTLH